MDKDSKYVLFSISCMLITVASCNSEIKKITVPEASHDDEQMKEVFKLVVSSFERLFDKSSRSYSQKATFLET